ncbi:NADH:flavin oxidoreductase/NADH oxidase [Leucobacter tenebrionis]|uniref:NADH:flavin oxidoreductase/NADH oxidase n=1 Tax=Leucobacter tenebrionis TaxID=2873270 RepID=UPI001CA6FECC|nr:NADH:flavin oxidoreductase/NADH oxidase [Leucobacter tenebrionis]QZY51746.1 NADH:flavin oxidoreductase/NADH oxidase [Leucobacter tenebrionis]
MADPILFRPFRLRNLEVRNRLWASPMCQYSAEHEDGAPGDWHLQHVGALARGGAGLVVMEATAVTPEGRISSRDLGLWNEDQTAAFARVTAIAHSHGARIAVQLAHAGRKASTYPWLPGRPEGSVPVSEGGWQTVAPSEVPFGDFAAPHALSTDEVAGLVEAFAAAADRAVAAGFDAVEVHAAHGYLLHEFLSPLSNLRDDDYGGDAERRARLLREVVRAIRARHADLPILVRISATEWIEGGFGLDEAEQLVARLAEDGVDLIDVSSGGNVPAARIPVGPAYQTPLTAHLRGATPAGSLAFGAVGLITDAAQAESLLVTGQADAIFVGRPLLADPHLPLRWAHELRAPAAASLVPPQYHRARF